MVCGSTRPPAPDGSITSPATPRTRSRASSAFRARRRSAWFRWRSASGSSRSGSIIRSRAAWSSPRRSSCVTTSGSAKSRRPIRPRRHRRSASRKSPRRSSNVGCAVRSRRSSASARAARCAPSPTNCRRWNARNTSWSRWSAPPRPMARLRSTTSSFACPTACARRTTRCRCRSSPARSRSASS